MPGSPSVPFQGQTIAHLGDQRVVCRAGTISADGMELFSPVSAKPGQFVRVTFQLEEEGKWLDVDAVLVSQAFVAQQFGWGLQFQAVPAHVAALIARYIEQAGAAPPARLVATPAPRQANLGGTPPLRRVPTGPHFPVTASPRSGGTGTQPSLRRVPTGPQPPVAGVPPGSSFRFTAAPVARSGGTPPSSTRVPTRQFPVTASPAVASSGRKGRPRQEADEDGLSDLYAEAVEDEDKKEDENKKK